MTGTGIQFRRRWLWLGVPLVGAGLAMSAAAADIATNAATAPFTRASATLAVPDEDGFIRRWLLLEPIEKPNRTNIVFTGSYVRDALSPKNFPGRFPALPRDGEIVRAAKPLQWHGLDSTLFDVKLFDFARSLGKPTYGVIFWAVTVIDSPRDMHDVRLAVGSNSASMWWLGGQEVAGLYGDRRMVMDDVVSEPLTLHKGRNILRGAVINGPGLSDFCVRFLDKDNRPVRDLTVRLR